MPFIANVENKIIAKIVTTNPEITTMWLENLYHENENIILPLRILVIIFDAIPFTLGRN